MKMLYFRAFCTLLIVVSAVAAEEKWCKMDSSKVSPGKKWTRNDAVYECNERGGWDPWGCAIEDGRQIKAGETFQTKVGKFEYWFTCESRDSGLRIRAEGCAKGTQRYLPGDRFAEGAVRLRCDVDSNGGTNVVVAGCMQTDADTGEQIERLLGCYWDIGKGLFQVTYACKANEIDKSAHPIAVHCKYTENGSGFHIPIGCYREFEKKAVACGRDSSGQVTAVQLDMDEKTYKAKNVPSNVKNC